VPLGSSASVPAGALVPISPPAPCTALPNAASSSGNDASLLWNFFETTVLAQGRHFEEKPPLTAKSSGDVHIQLLDGGRYDFQAVGEFFALRAEQGSVKIQVRQQPFGSSRSVSVATALAMDVAGDIIAVYAGSAEPLRVNHRPVASQDAVVRLPHGGEVDRQQSGFIVVWPSRSEAQIFYGSYLDYYVTLCSADQITGGGLLGNPAAPENSFMPRRGTAVQRTAAPEVYYQQLYHVFGDSWRINQSESLFDYQRGQSTKTFTDENFPYQPDPTAGLTQSQKQNAEAICRRAGISDSDVLRECILDVGVTGDAAFAENSALTEAMYAQSRDCLAPTDTAAIANADFEQVQIAPSPALSKNPNDVPGWTHTGAAGDGLLVRVGFADGSGRATNAGCGRQFIILGGGRGVPGSASWQTTIGGLKPGQSYALSFRMASKTTSEQTVTVTLADGVSATQTFGAPPSSANYWRNWVTRQFEFTPTASTATLTFSANTSMDVGLDHVVVKAHRASAIKVVAGTYGGNCGQPHGNKTQFLADSCNGKLSCYYAVNYGVIGDPAVGCAKDYVAEWRCGDDTTVHSVTVAPEAGYGGAAQLSCPATGSATGPYYKP